MAWALLASRVGDPGSPKQLGDISCEKCEVFVIFFGPICPWITRYPRCKPCDALHCHCALLPCWSPMVALVWLCVTCFDKMGLGHCEAPQYHGTVHAGLAKNGSRMGMNNFDCLGMKNHKSI